MWQHCCFRWWISFSQDIFEVALLRSRSFSIRFSEAGLCVKLHWRSWNVSGSKQLFHQNSSAQQGAKLWHMPILVPCTVSSVRIRHLFCAGGGGKGNLATKGFSIWLVWHIYRWDGRMASFRVRRRVTSPAKYKGIMWILWPFEMDMAWVIPKISWLKRCPQYRFE